ncbi:SDR family oxidoreductase [Photobacterium sp. ZSDE20]|uniref:SDR family oxidoreductase n=1 Tax=Photobacterium pectinilyticum TaxID=2906793 RepID=A0ABT1MWM7_9GAMM|nr:SDR family oxidoreductase [Photobacterium sp. ZSDE20]MCQ1056903.1 SDR family oxidoreductase [Photobacterium sp. ZSDE20]MDD1821038.1 SDR family oxidoreductase [Photobacterium sp. ZSDE20]
MKPVVLFGASRGLGFAVARHFRERDIDVYAMVRKPESAAALEELGVKVTLGDALEQNSIKSFLEDVPKDVVAVSTMGSFQADNPVDYIGHRMVINELEQRSIRRFVMVTSLGCGDSWAYLSDKAKAVFGQAVREKSLAESWLATSPLDYTILRPGGLQDGEATEQGVLSSQGEVHGLITRSEVARLIQTLLLDDTSIGKIYACVDPVFTRNFNN